MSENAFPANSGAMPKSKRCTVMARAWQIFRETYRYPQIKLASIGRHCFVGCLQRAWAEWRQARAAKAIPAPDRRKRIKALLRQIEVAQYADSYSTTHRIESACRAEIALLAGKGVHLTIR